MKFTTISDNMLSHEMNVVMNDLADKAWTGRGITFPYATDPTLAWPVLRTYAEMRKVNVEIKQSFGVDSTIWDVTLKDSRENGVRSWRAVGLGLNQPTLARAVCLAIVNHWYDSR